MHYADLRRAREELTGPGGQFEIVEEEVPVKGGAAEKVRLRYAEGRPVVSQAPARQRAVAIATVSMLPGANMRFAIIAINLSKD